MKFGTLEATFLPPWPNSNATLSAKEPLLALRPLVPAVARVAALQNSLPKRSRLSAPCSKQPTSRLPRSPPASASPVPPSTEPSSKLPPDKTATQPEMVSEHEPEPILLSRGLDNNSQIQFLLGHVSVQTTERYLGCKQRFRNAVNDRIGLEPIPLENQERPVCLPSPANLSLNETVNWS